MYFNCFFFVSPPNVAFIKKINQINDGCSVGLTNGCFSPLQTCTPVAPYKVSEMSTWVTFSIKVMTGILRKSNIYTSAQRRTA